MQDPALPSSTTHVLHPVDRSVQCQHSYQECSLCSTFLSKGDAQDPALSPPQQASCPAAPCGLQVSICLLLQGSAAEAAWLEAMPLGQLSECRRGEPLGASPRLHTVHFSLSPILQSLAAVHGAWSLTSTLHLELYLSSASKETSLPPASSSSHPDHLTFSPHPEPHLSFLSCCACLPSRPHPV